MAPLAVSTTCYSPYQSPIKVGIDNQYPLKEGQHDIVWSKNQEGQMARRMYTLKRLQSNNVISFSKDDL